MKKILLGSTALVAAGMIASAPASAKMKLSVGGYMEQWVGYVSQDDVGGQDLSGVDVKHDAEIHFKGMTKLDNGMSVGVNVQLEANTSGDTIDESYLILKGGFGEINIGSENSASYKMHYGAPDMGIGFNSGDQSSWANTGGTISQSGHFREPLGSTNVEPNGMNDTTKVTYYTPRVNGFQLGVSYTPMDGSEDSNGQPNRNGDKTDIVSAGMNFKQKMGGMSVAVSATYGTVTDAATDSTNEPQSMAFGLRLGMGAFGINIATAQLEDSDGGKDGTAVQGSVTYTDGPLGVSLGYHNGEREGDADTKENQAEADVFHASAKYSLGSGVSWASTLGYASYTSDDPTLANDEHNATYFVTGLKVGF